MQSSIVADTLLLSGDLHSLFSPQTGYSVPSVIPAPVFPAQYTCPKRQYSPSATGASSKLQTVHFEKKSKME